MGALLSNDGRRPHIREDQLRIVQELEMYLKNLEVSSKTIKDVVDAEHALLQNFFDKRDVGKKESMETSTPSQLTGTESGLSDLNEHELRALAPMQDIFCTHACMVNNATTSLRRLFNEFSQTVPDLLSDGRQTVLPANINTYDTSKMGAMQKDADTQVDNQSLKQIINERDAQINVLKESLHQKERHDNELRESISSLRQKVRQLEYESKANNFNYPSSKQKRLKVSASLYTPRKGDLLDNVTTELRGMLMNQFATQNTDLVLIDCDKVPDIAPDKPVIVICINASRLGTDVSSALQGLQYNSQIAVVILHHKEIHALPNQSSERILTSAEYKTIGGMFDMAFLSNRGLYTCDLNNKSLSGLVDFINQRNKLPNN